MIKKSFLKPEGAVVLEQGKALLYCPDGVNIKNCFEVKRGTTLEINPHGHY